MCCVRLRFIATACCIFLSVHVYTMCSVASFVLPIFEALAAQFALLALSYACEVAGDRTLLAGVEIELPRAGVTPSS